MTLSIPVEYNVRPLRLKWSQDACRHCGAELLEVEQRHKICCSNGAYITPRLMPLPADLENVFKDARFKTNSRKLNYLLAIAAVGVVGGGEGSFINNLPGCFAVGGRIYHRILNHETYESPLKWFLHSPTEQSIRAEALEVPLDLLHTI